MSTPVEQKQQVHRIRMWIIGLVVVVIGGIFAWSYLFNPASKDDASDAYYACVDVMSREVIHGVYGEPGDQQYQGRKGNWTITGTFMGALGDPVPYTCTATRMTDGTYRITWE